MQRSTARGAAVALLGLLACSEGMAADPVTPAASAVSSVERVAPSAAVLQPLPLRRDNADNGFPVAGTVFMLVLIAVMLASWWLRQRQGVPLLERLRPRGSTTPAVGDTDMLRVGVSVRLDLHTRLHEVEWRGRRMLVAVSGQMPPVVLDRLGDTPSTGATS